MSEHQEETEHSRPAAPKFVRAAESVLILGLVFGLLSLVGLAVGPAGLGLTGDTPGLGLILGDEKLSVDAELVGPVDLGDRLNTVAYDDGVVVDKATGQAPVGIGEPVVAQFTFNEPSVSQRVIWAVWHGTGSLLVMAGLWLVLLIVRSANVGDPFTRVNVNRLWGLAAIVAFGGVGYSWLSGFASMLMVQRSAAADLAVIQFEMELSPLLFGLVVAVLAGVWKIGVEMRDDLDGTV